MIGLPMLVSKYAEGNHSCAPAFRSSDTTVLYSSLSSYSLRSAEDTCKGVCPSCSVRDDDQLRESRSIIMTTTMMIHRSSIH